MRSREEVMVRFVEVRNAKLKERKQEYLGRRPANCEFNERMKVKGRGLFRLCGNRSLCSKSKNGLRLCMDDATAEACPGFSCRSTEESVERDFMDVLRSPARCGEEYPKLAVMIWFLQEFECSGRTARLKALVWQGFEAFCRVVAFRWW